MKNQRWRGAAAVEEGCRIIAITFVSLLLPLSFLLLARLSATRYISSAAVSNHEISFLTSVFVRSSTTLILSFLVIAVAIETLLRGDKRRRLWVALVMISLMKICLSLGIHGGAAVAEIRGSAAGNLVLARRAVFVLGLHEVTLFWRRSVVAPVVDGFSREGFGLVEEVILAAGFGNLWWRRLKDEAEALVVVPWVRAEVEVADAVGLLLYYLTAVIGGVRVIKGLIWSGQRDGFAEVGRKGLTLPSTFPFKLKYLNPLGLDFLIMTLITFSLWLAKVASYLGKVMSTGFDSN